MRDLYECNTFAWHVSVVKVQTLKVEVEKKALLEENYASLLYRMDYLGKRLETVRPFIDYCNS